VVHKVTEALPLFASSKFAEKFVFDTLLFVHFAVLRLL
jgi:hypothetical protein